VATVAQPDEAAAPTQGSLKRKLIRGAVAVGVLVAIGVCLIVLVPGLSGLRSAISDASPGWVVAAAVIQLVAVGGAVVFVQLVFADEPHRLTWKMGGAQQAANAVLPTAGSTAVSYWVLTSIGWGAARFAERAAVMIIAPAVPNVVFIVVFGLGMGLGLFAGPNDWWLTWLPAALGIVAVVVAIWAARWGHKLAARTKRRWLREGLHVVATGVTGTVEVVRQRNWRVLGSFVDVLGLTAALWACLHAVGGHLPFAAVAMGFLIGQFAQAIPIPGGVGAIDGGVTGALVLYGGGASVSAAGEIIAHGLAIVIPIVAGGVGFALLPREISRTRRSRSTLTAAPRPAGSS